MKIGGAVKDWLKDLPTTSLVIATGCVLAVLTGLFFYGSTIVEKPIDDANWGMWLAFLAGMLGFGYAQFAKKRDTTNPEIIDATARAQERVIDATARAVPPLTPTQAVEAGRNPDPDSGGGGPTPTTLKEGE